MVKQNLLSFGRAKKSIYIYIYLLHNSKKGNNFSTRFSHITKCKIKTMTSAWLSKWFCDTSTSAATGAARCGSFVGRGFGLLVVSYGWMRWIWRYTWFRPAERNTLCPRENWVILHKHALPEPVYLSAPVKWRMPEPFIAQGTVVTLRPEAQQVAPRWLKPYIAYMVIMVRSNKWCLAWHQQRGVVLSYHSAALNMARPMVPSCQVISHL
jgi:hypothetical protein